MLCHLVTVHVLVNQCIECSLLLKMVIVQCKHRQYLFMALHMYCFQKGSSSPPTSSAATTTETAPTTPVTPQTATDGLRYRGANTPTYPQYNMYQ